MTNSIYTLSSIKREPSPVAGPDYMDINSDEAEAGSILLSLSKHSKQSKETPTTTTTNSMSIRNLLGDTDDEQQRPMSTLTVQDQYQVNEAHLYATTSSSKEMHRYPETTKKNLTTFFDERSHYPHGMHAPSTSTTHPAAATSPHITSPLISAQQRPSESSDWKQQHYPYPKHDSQKYLQTNHNQPPTYSQQSYQSMKKDPKIRRNALHAYISYMTYSDLARIKASRMNPTQSYSTQPTKQPHNMHPHHSSSTPMALTERPMQHQWPLTAYLKHQPSTHSRPPSDWNPNYHSPPPPTQYHHHHPYPSLSHSALKNAHDKRP